MGLAWQQGPLSEGAAGRFLVPDPLPERLLYAEPLRRRMRVQFGGAPRWYVPPADVEDSLLTPAQGQTFCPYKGLCSYYDIPDARRAAWSYTDAWAKIRCVCGLVSFEPDKVEMHLDGARLRLEPGQNVISHGLDHELTPDEIASREQA